MNAKKIIKVLKSPPKTKEWIEAKHRAEVTLSLKLINLKLDYLLGTDAKEVV